MARKQSNRKGKLGNKPYKVYTRPELYDEDKPLATWLLRAGIVLSMLAIAAIFRQPLHDALVLVFKA